MPLPTHEPNIPAGVICLVCGLAGSGKTTYAQQFERRGLVRLSIDEYIWRHFGQYGVDYSPDRYEGHQQLTGLLRTGKPAVLDYSFWQRAERARYTALIESHHRPWKLLVLATTQAEARARLLVRRERFDANAAFPITDKILDSYAAGFETPRGEGEISVRT